MRAWFLDLYNHRHYYTVAHGEESDNINEGPMLVSPTWPRCLPSSVSQRLFPFLLAMALLPFVLTGCGTSLMLAANQGDSETIRTLLEDGVDVNARLPFCGTWAIILAAGNGHLETVRVLAEAGADIDAADWTGWTALHAAATKGHTSIVAFLLERHARLSEAGWALQSPLHWAEAAGHKEIVELIKEASPTPAPLAKRIDLPTTIP